MTNGMTVSLPDDDSGKPFPDTQRCRESFIRTLMSFALLFAALFGAYELYGKIPVKKSSSAIREISLAACRNNASLSVNDALDENTTTSLRFNFSQLVRDLLKQQNIGNGKQEIAWNDEFSTHYLLQRKNLPEPSSDFGISSYYEYTRSLQISSILRNITPARAGPLA